MVKNTVTKKEIREKFLKERDRIPVEERSASQRKITDNIIGSFLYEEARCIYTYVSVKSEADTVPIIKRALMQGKRVAAPRVRGRHTMEFYFIRSLADLQPGFHGIPEPGPWCPKAPPPEEDALVIMPGVAFDRSGARIGYGGGYYDAYLENNEKCRRIAPAFSLQIAGEIPMQEHDIRAEFIFTEKELIRCGQNCPGTR